METCKERVKTEFKEFVEMLNKAYDYKMNGYIDSVGEDITFTQKARAEDKVTQIYDEVRTLLSLEMVEKNTFGHNGAYQRYLFSWGGPSDEVRIYDNGRAEYWFMDWFDGAKKLMGQHLVDKLEAVYGW